MLLPACSSKEPTDEAPEVVLKESDFTLLCQEFEQLTESSAYSTMDSEARAERLTVALKTKLTEESLAFIAWSAIQSGPPAARYNLLVEAASSVGEQEWDCPAIKAHGHEVGSKFE